MTTSVHKDSMSDIFQDLEDLLRRSAKSLSQGKLQPGSCFLNALMIRYGDVSEDELSLPICTVKTPTSRKTSKSRNVDVYTDLPDIAEAPAFGLDAC